MKLSESLRSGMMETSVGGIINKFKIKKRRVTLFFEDIIANYVKACDDAGHEKEMEKIGRLWGRLTAKILIPDTIKKLPPILFSQIAKKVWSHIGMMEDVEIRKSGNRIILITKRDAITRIVGKNNFVAGSFTGVLEMCFNCELKPVKIIQSEGSSNYVYNIMPKKPEIDGKDKDEYNMLNTIPFIKGFTLKDMVKKGIFSIRNNRIYFRGKSISYSENTMFHLIGNMGILLEKVPEISYKYFSEIVDKDVSEEKILLLLKTLLRVMGWGVVNIQLKDDAVVIEINNLPCGLQSEKENWSFLVQTILGYLWVIDKSIKLKKTQTKKRYIKLEYSAG